MVIAGKDGFDYLVQDPGGGAAKGLYPLRELGSDIEALRFYEPIAKTISQASVYSREDEQEGSSIESFRFFWNHKPSVTGPVAVGGDKKDRAASNSFSLAQCDVAQRASVLFGADRPGNAGRNSNDNTIETSLADRRGRSNLSCARPKAVGMRSHQSNSAKAHGVWHKVLRS